MTCEREQGRWPLWHADHVLPTATRAHAADTPTPLLPIRRQPSSHGTKKAKKGKAGLGLGASSSHKRLFCGRGGQRKVPACLPFRFFFLLPSPDHRRRKEQSRAAVPVKEEEMRWTAFVWDGATRAMKHRPTFTNLVLVLAARFNSIPLACFYFFLGRSARPANDLHLFSSRPLRPYRSVQTARPGICHDPICYRLAACP